MKKVISTLLILVVLLLAAVGLNQRGEKKFAEKPTITRLQGSYSIDINDIPSLIGDADYVFVAEVINLVGYDYKFPVTVEDENGNDVEVTSPYTNYEIQILENIKGNLITSQVIPLQKAGGLTEDGKYYSIYENDELPKVGDICIFYAYAQSDGSLLVSGPNSNAILDVSDEIKAQIQEVGELENSDDVVVENFSDKDITVSEDSEEKYFSLQSILESDEYYCEVMQALEHQIETNRKRMNSIYEQ